MRVSCFEKLANGFSQHILTNFAEMELYVCRASSFANGLMEIQNAEVFLKPKQVKWRMINGSLRFRHTRQFTHGKVSTMFAHHHI